MTVASFEQVPGEPEPPGRPFPGVFHYALRGPLGQHRYHGAQRQEREQRADHDEEDDGDDHLQQQAGELQRPVQGPGRGEQAVTDQGHGVGDIRGVQVIDAGRPVDQVHELPA